jgi:hypothetical protein
LELRELPTLAVAVVVVVSVVTLGSMELLVVLV